MYQIVVNYWINGKREKDSLCPNIYKYRKTAERKAKDLFTDSITILGDHLTRKAYVRNMLIPATEEEAKVAYCKCNSIWINTPYGIEKIRSSWEYGSHAPAEELFYRSCGYGYDGNYYIEDN